MAQCRSCGTVNPAEHRFCSSCGSSLTTVCGSCGTPAQPDQRFCGACGSPLAATPEAAPSPVAERRVCSVLFADLVGFTPLSESRDAEQVRELLSEYFATARTVISRYGGVVEKFIGDAVMAVWGTPVAVEGDAERAVRAALDVIDAVAELGERVGATGLAARAGVVTAEVAVTLGATGEGMVAGDAVNTAARVQTTADPGSVLVDDATHRLAAAAIGFADAGQHTLKGKSDDVQLWRAIRVLANVGGVQRVDGLEAPLIGRDAELRTIKELLHATLERRTPRLVVVSGPAGIGKSRLGWEFEKYVDGLAEHILWHRGRCLSYGEGVSFWALAEIVRQRFGIAEEESLDVVATKLRDRLDEFVPDPDERDYIGPRLGRLLGVRYAEGGDEPLSRDELYAGWRLFFERLARAQPTILLIEDAQHADLALLDFIDHLVDWARNVPVYVLMFARPELVQQRSGWAAGRNRSVLTLDPLDGRSMDTLLHSLVTGMGDDAVTAIAQQAQGNPLFAVETVRSLIDRDAVIPVNGAYQLVGSVGELTVPDSLHGLLAARLDSLDPDLRALVADAAVLGISFPAEALAAVSGRDLETLEPRLHDLVHRDVLEISADPLSPQRGHYRFEQNLLRQVAYETLSRRDRKTRHIAVAAHLRSVFANDGDEVADVIARHYLDALSAVPDDGDVDELRGQAIAMLVRAAERAQGSGAPARAAETYATAAGLAEALGGPDADLQAAELWERTARMWLLASPPENALRATERAGRLYDRSGRTRASARTAVLAGRALGYLGRNAESREVLQAAVETLRTEQDADTVRAIGQLAALEIFAGTTSGCQLADEALALGQDVDVPTSLLAELFVIAGLGYGFVNRIHDAIATLEYGARLAERSGDSATRARALLNIASLVTAPDPAAGSEAARTACELCRRVGAGALLPVAILNAVVADLLTGNWDAGAMTIAEAIDADALGDDEAVLSASAVLAALRGDLDTARRQAALPGWRASDDPQNNGAAVWVDLMIAASAGEPPEVLRLGEQVLELSDSFGLNHEVVYWSWDTAVRAAFGLGDTAAVERFIIALDAHPVGQLPPLLRAGRSLAQARLAALRGDPDSEERLTAALGALRNTGSPYHLAHGLLDLAEHRTPASRAALVDEAADIAHKLGAAPLAARAADLQAPLPTRAPVDTV